MRAWRLAARDVGAAPVSLHMGEAPEPAVAADEVLVRVRASVCGAPELLSIGPHIPGGAAVGTVVAAGEQAAHLTGKLVLVGPEHGCGECDVCRRGEPVSCPHGYTLGRTRDGTLAELVSARARWVCALYGDLTAPVLETPAAALLAREAAWAYAMFARAGVAPGEPVFIAGGDVVARLLVEVALAKGVRPMVIHRPEQRAFAQWIADREAVPMAMPVDPSGRIDLAALSRDAGALARDSGHGRRPWFVFQTSADHDQRRATLALATPGSRITMLARRASGHATLGPALDLDGALDQGSTIIGLAGAHPDLLPEVAALAVRGQLDVVGAARVVPVDALDHGLAADEPSAPVATVLDFGPTPA